MTLVAEMSRALGLPIPFIEGIARKASYAYKVYQIPKRSGGMREISHPARPLKALQRWLLRAVVEQWPVHRAAYAYVRAGNIQRHALEHATSSYLLRMDFEAFFRSITIDDIAHYLTASPATESWSQADRELFLQLVTRFGRLTIGAPTSPALSNALCFDLDTHCTALAVDNDVRYTRYADDLFFSTTKPDILSAIPMAVEGIVSQLVVPENLKINASKERHSSKRVRRQVTGIVLSSDGRAVLGRARKRFIRHQIHTLNDLTSSERASLRGLISFATDIESGFINDLILKYGHEVVMSAWKG